MATDIVKEQTNKQNPRKEGNVCETDVCYFLIIDDAEFTQVFCCSQGCVGLSREAIAINSCKQPTPHNKVIKTCYSKHTCSTSGKRVHPRSHEVVITALPCLRDKGGLGFKRGDL
eukprot:2695553-Amphidinium_carterae.1